MRSRGIQSYGSLQRVSTEKHFSRPFVLHPPHLISVHSGHICGVVCAIASLIHPRHVDCTSSVSAEFEDDRFYVPLLALLAYNCHIRWYFCRNRFVSGVDQVYRNLSLTLDDDDLRNSVPRNWYFHCEVWQNEAFYCLPDLLFGFDCHVCVCQESLCLSLL